MKYILELILVGYEDEAYFENPSFEFDTLEAVLKQAVFFLEQGYKVSIDTKTPTESVAE